LRVASALRTADEPHSDREFAPSFLAARQLVYRLPRMSDQRPTLSRARIRRAE
jgi:hypothetical protein